MSYTKNGRTFHCPVEAALEVIGGKWKALILWHLCDGVKRFSELQRELPGVNAKMLTRQLRELEGDGIVQRTVYPEVPPRVEYAVTEFGRTLLPILEALCAWGTQYLGTDGGTAPGCPAKAGREEA
jgi:DNA-binding HxlR family transcriptional regulator